MTTTYTLSFELRPDSTPTAPGASDTTTCGITLNGTSFGTFTSLVQGGASCIPNWKAFSVDVTGTFDPGIANHLRLFYSSGNDRSHWRRIKVTGSTGSIYYGEYPAGFAYTSALQDGILGSDTCGGQLLEMASDGADPANQWNAQTSAYVTPGEGDDAIHLYFSVADVSSPPGIYLDWDSDGFGTGSYDNVSSRTQSYSISRGASPELAGGSQPGSCTLVLTNADDRYNPENSGSPIYTKLRDGVPVWIAANNAGTFSGGAGVNGLFAGRLTDISPLPAGGASVSPTVELVFEDALGAYARTSVTVADALDRSQHDLRLAALAAAGETRYDLPDEPRGLPLSSFDGKLGSLLDSINGANGTRHYIRPADNYADWYAYTARNRIYKVGAAADGTLNAGSDHVTDTSGWRKTADVVVNQQQASITPLVFPDFRSTVWQAETLPIIVHSGESRVIWATFDDFVTDAEVEITSTTATTASLTSFGRTAKITLSAPPCHVTRLVITGRKVQRGLEQSVVVDDATSQAEPRGVRAGSPIGGDLVGSLAAATGIATAVVWRFAQPQYRPTLTVVNWLPYQFQLDLFDLIAFTSSELKVSARLFEIVGLTHTSDFASSSGVLHTTVYTLQECRQQAAKTWFTWDSSVWDGANVWAYL